MKALNFYDCNLDCVSPPNESLEQTLRSVFKFFHTMEKPMVPMFSSQAVFKPEMPMLLSSLLNYSYSESLLSLAALKIGNALLYAYIVLTWWSNIILWLSAMFQPAMTSN